MGHVCGTKGESEGQNEGRLHQHQADRMRKESLIQRLLERCGTQGNRMCFGQTTDHRRPVSASPGRLTRSLTSWHPVRRSIPRMEFSSTDEESGEGPGTPWAFTDRRMGGVLRSGGRDRRSTQRKCWGAVRRLGSNVIFTDCVVGGEWTEQTSL